jgi:hypothetical protein
MGSGLNHLRTGGRSGSRSAMLRSCCIALFAAGELLAAPVGEPSQLGFLPANEVMIRLGSPVVKTNLEGHVWIHVP